MLMEVDSFRFVSPLVSRYYRLSKVKSEYPIPWTPLSRPLTQARFGLVTTGGLYRQGHEPPFDLERERREPTWGDPGFRTIPTVTRPGELGVSHLHINPKDVLEDMNILLPIQRFQELCQEGRIHSLAPHAYSFMGYQGFPAKMEGWKKVSGPQVAKKLTADGANCVLLTTA